MTSQECREAPIILLDEVQEEEFEFLLEWGTDEELVEFLERIGVYDQVHEIKKGRLLEEDAPGPPRAFTCCHLPEILFAREHRLLESFKRCVDHL